MGTRATVWGLLLAVMSAASFGTSGSFAGALLVSGWSPGAAVTTRIGVAALLLTVPALLQLRGRWDLLRANALLIALFGVLAVAAAQLFFFLAVERVPVGVAILLEYSGVLLVVGWLWWRHGERPGRLTVAGAALAIGGLVLVLDLLGGTSLDPLGVLWGLIAATGLATYFVLSSRVEGALPPLVVAWAGMVVATATLALAAVVGVLPFTTTATDVLLAEQQVSWLVPVAGLAVLAAAFAYVAGIFAARLLGATLSSFVGLTEVLFAVVIAWLLLGQEPGAVQALGGALVLAGVALVRLDGRTPSPDPSAEAVVARASPGR